MLEKIEESYGMISDANIAALESRLGLVLPDGYRRFLLRNNGGAPVPDAFDVPGWHHVNSRVARFYGIHAGPHSNLEKDCAFFAERLPPAIIPIADDQGGNIICLGIEGKRRGKIYFWDHEDEFDEHGEGRQDYGNVYFLANSIDEFLRQLRE
ncbi:MAG: SMI1/KNR4 family protein [Polyangiaceae bacterium]|nr:SMI1/KNR4 family protein [Polyangiaceae bacterium]